MGGVIARVTLGSIASSRSPAPRGAALDLLTRFGREAKAIAALAHPHICTLFDIGHEAGTDYLVMEYLEGETLADALRRRALPFEHALKTAVEIGEALDHAHHAGIVHRDLKPSNVMLTDSGAKLLDFGLAKFHTQRSGAGTTRAITESLSAESGITGTVPYMAPEQLEGREGDARSDLFAFGALLYEMVTGRRAFVGESQANVMAAILEHHPPPMSTLQPLVPPALDRVVKKCLAKDPEDRWQTARDLVDELKWIEDGAKTPGKTDVFDGMRTPHWTRTNVALTLAVALVSVALGTLFGGGFRGNLRETSARFWVAPPPGSTFARGGATTFIALSPDGSQLAFVASESARVPATRIWIRPLSALEARPVPGTEAALSVFWSPDGRSLGFFTFDKLKRVDLSENSVSTMSDAVDGLRSTGTWGSDGRILFASVLGESILSVAAAGGGPSPEVHRDEARGETFLQWPSFLPDGRRFVYVARLSDGSRQLMLKDAAGATHPILSVASKAEWVEPGYFVFARRDGTLMAQRFDLSRERIVGEPSLIAQSVDYAFTPGRAMFTASQNGNLAYQPQQFQRMICLIAPKELVCRPGKDYGRLKLSPNGGDLLFSRIQPGTAAMICGRWICRAESRLTSILEARSAVSGCPTATRWSFPPIEASHRHMCFPRTWRLESRTNGCPRESTSSWTTCRPMGLLSFSPNWRVGAIGRSSFSRSTGRMTVARWSRRRRPGSTRGFHPTVALSRSHRLMPEAERCL
jgi:serine/threonine protein kinase